MKDSKKNDRRVIPWNLRAEEAFEQIKQDLANAAMLSHPFPDAEIRLVADASDTGIGAALEQFIDNDWKPLAFFFSQVYFCADKL